MVMTTTIFNLAQIGSQKDECFIYSVDERRVVESLDEYNNIPIPMPSHLYIRITHGLTTSSLCLTDNERNAIDIPEDDFWVIENVVNGLGNISGRMLLQPETFSSRDRQQPYNCRTFFRLVHGKDYRIVYNGKTVLTIVPQQSWKITSICE
jgi:hypothetical protein